MDLFVYHPYFKIAFLYIKKQLTDVYIYQINICKYIFGYAYIYALTHM